MSDIRRIAVVSSTRADYGLLRWTLEALRGSAEAELQLIATGAHLSSSLGRTIDVIRDDGFEVAAEIDMMLDGRDRLSTASAAGRLMMGLADTLRQLQPHLMLVLGDRYEILAAAQTAYLGRIPIAHLHGGEVTTGSLDDGNRHAITKLSRLHLTSTEAHRRRVLQLGEPADAVHVVGAPGLENLARLSLDDRTTFQERLGCRLGEPAFLLVYHPATAESGEDPVATMDAILEAMRGFPNASILATGSNADAGAAAATDRLKQRGDSFGGRLVYRESLGQEGFLSALKNSDVIIGNSSSGIIEAPSAGTPTVNIGARQNGRPRAASVLDAALNISSIRTAVENALSPEMQALSQKKENPYFAEKFGPLNGIGEHVAKLLIGTDLTWLRAAKPFCDSPLGESGGR